MRVRVTAANGVVPDGVEVSEPTAKVSGGGGGGSGADLAALLRASTAGNQVTYTVRVTNVGSADADGVVLTATLPAEVTVVSAATARGSCSGRVTCSIGQVKAGETVAVTIVVTASQTGTYSFSATITSATPDVDPSNNTAATGSRLSVVGLDALIGWHRIDCGQQGDGWLGLEGDGAARRAAEERQPEGPPRRIHLGGEHGLHDLLGQGGAADVRHTERENDRPQASRREPPRRHGREGRRHTAQAHRARSRPRSRSRSSCRQRVSRRRPST